MAYTLPQGDPSNPALPSPVFGDVSAARGDHLRVNNNFIWQNFTSLADLFDSAGKALDSVKFGGQLPAYYGIASDISTLQGYFTGGAAKEALKVKPIPISGTASLFDILASTTEKFVPFTSSTTVGVPVSGRTYYGFKIAFDDAQLYVSIYAFDTDDKRSYVKQRIGGTWNASWTQLTDANGNPPSAAFDLIIDSNAKLATWAAGGSFSRVLIKAGTWTLASGGVNLTAAGTKEVIGEPGSVLAFSSVSTYALYYTSAPTTNDYRMSGVNVTATASANGMAAFRQCVNLLNCSATVNGSAADSRGFANCSYLVGCLATITATTLASYGFIACNYVSKCRATVTTTTGNGYGYAGNTFLAECIATVTSSSNGPGYGFYICDNVGVCISTVTTGGSPAAAAGYYQCTGVSCCKGTAAATSARGSGFDSCTQVTGCQGVGTGSTGYGFYGCKKCVNNKAAGTSTTSTYNTSYADAGTAAACADTAAGGWNS